MRIVERIGRAGRTKINHVRYTPSTRSTAPLDMPLGTSPTAPEDRCSGCDSAAETTVVGWYGRVQWIYDMCWPCARRKVDPLARPGLADSTG